MPTSLIAPIVGAGASFGLGKLFGGGSQSSGLENFQGSGFSGGGLSGTFGGTVTPSGERLGLVGNLASTFGDQASRIAGQAATVGPGMNDFLRTRLDALDQAKTASIGNLRENLSRRRIMGSSFGQDAISRAEAEFAKAADATRADAFLKSLEVNNQLTQQEFAARRAEFQTKLDEMNLEASIASGLAAKASEIMSRNSQTAAMLDAQGAAGAGKFGGFFGNQIGNAAGKFFGGGGGFFGGGGGGGFDPLGGFF